MTPSQRTILSVVLATASAGCGAAPSEGDVALIQSAVTGNIVISGRVTNSSGGGLSNVTVTLAGAASTSQQTSATGAYSFGGLASGSYSVRPTRTSCAFSPNVVNLNNLNSSVTRNFVGSGSGCAAGGSGGRGAGGTGGTGGPAAPSRPSPGSTCRSSTTRSSRARAARASSRSRAGTTRTRWPRSSSPTVPRPATIWPPTWRVRGSSSTRIPVKEDGFQYTDATFMACEDNVFADELSQA